MNVQMPDGTIIEGVPDGMSKADLLKKYKPAKALDFDKLTYAPTVGMSTAERTAAGAGKAVADIGRGAMQMFGAESQDDLAEVKSRDDALMSTTSGKIGNVLGNVGAAAPSILVPGANTITGAAVTGAAMGALQPVESGSVPIGKIQNAAIGGVLSGAVQAGGQGLASLARGKIKALGEDEAANAVRDATLKSGQEAGYVVPPTQANPTVINRALEGFAGKLTTAQSASGKNQAVTNNLARESLGLAPDTPITKDTLKAVRNQAGQSYKVIKGMGTIGTDQRFTTDLSDITAKFEGASKDFPELAKTDISQIVASVNKPEFSANSGIDAISILRDRADIAYRKGDKDLGGAYRSASKALEDLIERNISGRGPKYADILKDYRDARQMIAKTYTVEAALNDATGNVNATKLGAQLKKGKPLSGELKTAGEFSNAFPKATQENLSSMPGISPLDYAVGGISSAASGNPALLGAVVGRPMARSALLSKMYQKAMTEPGYEPSMLTKMTPDILGNPRVQALLRNLAPAATFTYQK